MICACGSCRMQVRSGPASLMKDLRGRIDTSLRDWCTSLSAHVGIASQQVKAVYGTT